ncbi:MAG TPA: AMP-binding protein, partial [Jatrophihabitans sp.]|nr:AMP-binding protein [Jatrophihabitans sp.]
MDLIGTARHVVRRAGHEASYASTLLQARGLGVAFTPPHKLLGTLRDLEAYGPAGGAISLAAAGFGDRPALIDELGTVTFAELEKRSSALANALRARGFKARDGMGILARNHRGLYESIIAGAKLGARTLLLNTDFAGPQLADVVKREDVQVLIHDEEFADVAGAADVSGGKFVAWHDGDTRDDTLEGLIWSG